jgi:elongation factor G
LVGSALTGVGIDRLADFICEIGPSPLDRPTMVMAGDGEVDVKADASGAPLAFVFKTIADPYVGQLSLFKVLSGTVKTDDHLVNPRSNSDERLHTIFNLRGKDQQPASSVPAGDIAAVSKLASTHTGDTLAPKGTPFGSLAPSRHLPFCRWRSRRARRATTTNFPSPCNDCKPKTPPSWSSATTRPTRRFCGARATPTSPSPSRRSPASSA